MISDYEKVLKQTKELEAERILLREFRTSDAEDLLEYASDDKTVKYLVWDGVKTLDEAKKSIEEYYLSSPGIFAIELKENKKCIGAINLCVQPEHEKASFGYALNRKYWNQGYMSEALRVLLNFCFQKLELNRVESTHYIGNEASCKVMEKCGMKLEGVLPQELKIKGIFRDVAHYGILRETD